MGKLAKALSRQQAEAKTVKKQADKLKRRKEIEEATRLKRQTHKARPTIPFTKEDKLMLIGEGDFSFAYAVVKNSLVKSVACTSYDSREQVLQKYPSTAPKLLEFLEAKVKTEGIDSEGQHVDGLEDQDVENQDMEDVEDQDMEDMEDQDMEEDVSVHFDVDCTKLHQMKQFKNKFTAIMFNFPHLGNSVKDQARNIQQHQKLLVDFFSSAQQILDPTKGKILVTLFEGEPYLSWEIKKLAKAKNLKVFQSQAFNWSCYPGYAHRLTAKEGHTSKPQASRPARVYTFVPGSYKPPSKKRQPDLELD